MAATGPGVSRNFLVTNLAFLLVIFVSASTSDVCRFGSDSGCIFPCHCQSKDHCDRTTGHCDNGCQLDTRQGGPFSGPGCQIGNVALGKTASQVGTWSGMVASRAVDGVADPRDNNHCAHPEAQGNSNAWWQVDLGDVYVINNITIVNGNEAGANNYLHHFTISVGNSSDAVHTECVRYTDKVPAGSRVTLTCGQQLWGQFVKIERMTGSNKTNLLRICEVLVSGYKYRDCSDACIGSCDNVIGCDKCKAGKKLPDCTEDCDEGSYGIYCAQSCGHCAGSETCNKETGVCSRGCQPWYVTLDTDGPKTCRGHIVRVDYTSSPWKLSQTSSSVNVSWSRSDKVTAGLESYYQYVVEVTVNDQYVMREFVDYKRNETEPTAFITGLTHNTQYKIKVKMCARLEGQILNGSTGWAMTVKTDCKSPEKPRIKSVTAKLPADSGYGSLQVTWQSLGDSGCDRLQQLLVQYKSEPQGQWQDKPVTSLTQTQMTVDSLAPGSYSVRLSVTNNENMNSLSDTYRSTAVLYKVHYKSTPRLVTKTSFSVKVSWPKSEEVTAGLESYYQYVVEATASGQDPVQVTRQLESGQSDLTAVLVGLRHNSEYEIRVRVTDLTDTLTGSAGGPLKVKTECTAPDKPQIKNITAGSETLQITWKSLGDSGCDRLQQLLVQYKSEPQGQWQDKPVTNLTRTQMTVDSLPAGSYSVRLSVTNNENMNSLSDTHPQNYVLVVAATTNPSTQGTGESMTTTGSSGSSGVVIAVIMSLLVLIVLAVVAALLFIRLRRRVVWDRLTSKTFLASRTSPEGEDNEAINLQMVREDEDEDCDIVNVNVVPAIAASPVVGPPVAPRQEKVDAADGLYGNIDLGETRMKVDELTAYIRKKETQPGGFESEFNRLPAIEMAKMHVSKLPENKPKNRFRNIWAYDTTRVILDVDEENPSDYINANYITGYKNRSQAYVACQGPKDTTVTDMWRMIWQLKASRIAMTTQLLDCGRMKCHIYWPEGVGAQEKYDQFTVTSVASEVYADYTIRTLTVTYKGESRTVTHFQYTSWLDKGVPKFSYPLLAYRRLIRSFDDHSTGPIIVHCSAGIGRTGTFIALDSLLDMGQAEGEVDVFWFVSQTRTERMHMIQTKGQYEFLYHALADGLQRGHFAYPVSEFPDVYKRFCVDDEDWAEINEQFQLLDSLKPDQPHPNCSALQEWNKSKNRSLDIIPEDNHRPYLSTRSPGSNDYINAVYVDSFRKGNGYLLTQMPLPETVIDFWRLIYDQECVTVILLDEAGSQDSAPYWPEKEDPVQTHGTLTVELLCERASGIADVTERKLSVCLTAEPNRVHKVKQYQLLSGWPKADRLPSSTNTLLSLMELVNRPVSEDDHTGPVILQCTNGASRCGLFCAASHLLGSLTVDQYVDIFHSAQHVRNKRPQAIDFMEQYQFLYMLVVDFQKQNDPTYMNVPQK